MPAYKYTLKNGKILWYANFYYTDWTGKKQHVCKRGFKTQKEAKEYERSFTDKLKNSSDILFSSLIENYIEDMKHRLKPTTMETKEYLINEKILPYFQRLKISEIDTIAVSKWQNLMISYRDENGRPYSQTYLKTIHNQLSAIMNYAIKHYRLPSNPCRVVGSIGKSKADSMQIWTQEEYEIFSKNIAKSSFKLAFDILFYTGMRIGELLALTPADILPSMRIDINKNYAKVKGKELLLAPKSYKAKRCISIPEFIYDDIQNYISKLYEIEKDEQIFYFSKSGIEKEMDRIINKCGLKKIRIHDLRHSHVSMLIELGFSPLEIKERVGHESIKTTLDTYSHLYPDKDIKLADRLNQLRKKTE